MSLSTKRLAERFHKNPNRAASTGGQGATENAAGQPTGNAGVRSVVRHKLRLRHTSIHQRGTSHDVLIEKKDKEEALRAEEEEKKRKASDKAKATADELIQEKGPDEANVTVSETPPVDPSASKASLHSKSSKKATTSKLMGALTSAQPDAIKIDAPAKALVDKNGDGEADSDTDDDLEEHAFDHPSIYMDQRWIWIPKWEAHPELSEELVREIKEHNVDAADVGAIIDEGGNVSVTRGPPDEDWSGGHDR
ncbi:1042_t:CDS:2 [Acaulospora colombiana]|uniref:1042_t:CDS:1 n=1 Tax=Acaulospora colombiana TaxID=27376 RepID=A0ACA9MD42_9GLOM|nr:1042_t:CDS:2 [Acaulospora colombiana]